MFLAQVRGGAARTRASVKEAHDNVSIGFEYYRRSKDSLVREDDLRLCEFRVTHKDLGWGRAFMGKQVAYGRA